MEKGKEDWYERQGARGRFRTSFFREAYNPAGYRFSRARNLQPWNARARASVGSTSVSESDFSTATTVAAAAS